jgi:hypothetical protein
VITFGKLGQNGQIGNQMFQIAGTIGLATKYGHRYAFPKWLNLDGIANGNIKAEEAYIGRWFAKSLPFATTEEISRCKQIEVPWKYDDRFTPSDNSNLNGYMQSEKWFKHCESKIRTVFEWELPPPKVDAVAIHVRRGDYDGKNYNFLAERYYQKAMDIMRKRGHTRFEVFSDNTAEAERITGARSIECEDPMMALRMMSGYVGHIIANSSFSWWAAWLANSTDVVAPRKWVGRAMRLNTRDIVPHRWTKI